VTPKLGNPFYDQCSCGGSDSLTLELRQNTPTSLPCYSSLPISFPISDRTSRGFFGAYRYYENATRARVFRHSNEFFVTFPKFFHTFRSAKMLRHSRVSERSFQQWQVTFRVRTDDNVSLPTYGSQLNLPLVGVHPACLSTRTGRRDRTFESQGPLG